MLILRGENGFICHHRNSNTLDAGRSVYDIFSLQFSNGSYHIKGQVVRSRCRLMRSLLHLWLPVLKQICASSRNDSVSDLVHVTLRIPQVWTAGSGM